MTLTGDRGAAANEQRALGFSQEHLTPGGRAARAPGNDGSGRAVVLDPFVGAGTVALVAQRLGRSAMGIDLNPDYLAMARRRIEAEHAQRR
ncbi:MAG TPA: DNA methyltransferase, partial [Thermaerobacter sp.]